jgi:hypothetical protein
VRRFLCKLLWAFFGLGVLFGARGGRWAGGCGGQGSGQRRRPLVLATDPERRRRFRRRLREAFDELLAEEPEQPPAPQGQPTA